MDNTKSLLAFFKIASSLILFILFIYTTGWKKDLN